MITEISVIVIMWMDGESATYRGSTRLYEGVLHVYDESETYHIPLASIRYWTKPAQESNGTPSVATAG